MIRELIFIFLGEFLGKNIVKHIRQELQWNLK